MSTEFLDDDEILRLTGQTRPSRQIAWLREGGYAFVVNGKGRPAVYRHDGKALKTQRPAANGLVSEDTIVRRAISVRRTSGVYFLIAGSRVIYVGKSLHVMERVASHVRNQEIPFEAFYVINVIPERLEKVEAAYIRAFKPARNIVGK